MTSKEQLPHKNVQPAGFKRWKQKPTYTVFLTCLLIGLVASFPLWGPGIVNTRGGGDSPFLLQRTLDMAENIKHGALPPRWMSHAAYNYGYPFFNHYGAFPYYISAVLTLLGLPVSLAIQSTQTLGFVLAAVAMAMWTRKLYRNSWSTILSATAYTFAPFHMVNVYVRGDSLSEFYAFIWFPLILWALHRYLKQPTWVRLFISAIAYGGLIVTHNTSAVAFSPFALLYAAILIVKQRGFPRRFDPALLLKIYVAPVIFPFLLGMLLTTWFWLPALGETGYGQMGSEFTSGYFHHSQHYRGLNMVQRSPAFDYGIALQVDDSGPFAMGFIQAVLVVCGAGVLFLSYSDQISIWLKTYLAAGIALATFIMTPLSAILWDNIPLLSIMQFPWRFLAVQAVFTSAITAALPTLLLVRQRLSPKHVAYRRWIQWLMTTGVIVLLLFSALSQLHPDRLLINGSDITWETLGLYETFTGNIGTTIRYEYLPKDVVPRPYITQAILDGEILPRNDSSSDMDAKLLERNPNKQRWIIDVAGNNLTPGNVATIVFPLYWWPGWQAKIDGLNVPAYPFPGSGQLTVDVSQGTHDVVLSLKPTRLQLISLLTSCLSLVVICIPVIKELRKSNKIINPLNPADIVSILLLITIPLVPILRYRAVPDTGRYFDFDQMPYPHRGPIDFQLATLNDSKVSPEIAAPGDEITFRMAWALTTDEPLTGTLRLVSPAEHRHNVPYTLTETEVLISPQINVKLQLPDKLSRGLYLIQFRLHTKQIELRAKTQQGRSMGPLYIGAIRILEGTKSKSSQEPLVSMGDINLHTIQAYQTQSDSIDLEMVWTTSGTLRNLSLSIRLLDLAGQQITQRDLQPGYGFLPTSMWRQGEFIYDYLTLDIPEGLAPGEYQIRLIPYLQATMQVFGEYDVPVEIHKPTLYDLRSACCEQTRKGATILCQYAGIALLGIDAAEVITAGQNLSFTAEWNAVEPSSKDVSVQWALINSDNEQVSSLERTLATGSDTSTWPLHTWVLAPIHLELNPLLPAGPYKLQLTMHDNHSAGKQCTIKDIEVNSRSRVYTVPSLPHKVTATFNDEIRLLGYDISIKKTLKLVQITLWWQAKNIPQINYKRFLHIYDPATNVVITQDDAEPRNWTYPTTWWDKGEIVSETITLSLGDISKGTYSLGTGWYDPETMTRMEITSSDSKNTEEGILTISSLKIR